MDRKYVGFWRRLLAYLFDMFFFSSIYLVLTVSVLGIELNSSLYQLLSLIFSALYFVFFWGAQDGQTVGNRIMKIKVVKEDGTSIGFAGSIVRFIGFVFSAVILCIGFIWIAFDKKKQGLHDKLAKTFVVETGKPNTLLVIILLIVGLISYISLTFSFASGLVKNRMKDSGYEGNTSSLSNEVFNKVNEYRVNGNLSELTVDSRLCAYAQRRLEQLNTLGKNDDGKGFYEDTSNPQIMNAYFNEYGGLIGSNSISLVSYSTSEDIVDSWWNAEVSNLKEKTFTNGCVRADSKFLVLIFAAK